MEGSEKYRSFYARLICAAAKIDDPRIEEAFRSVMREPFAGPGRARGLWVLVATHMFRHRTTIRPTSIKTCSLHWIGSEGSI
jgi:hypothetical protein